MNRERSTAQLERHLDIYAARTAQLQEELERAYRKVAELREELSQQHELLRIEESVDLLQRFICWREGAQVPSRLKRCFQLLRGGSADAKQVAEMVREISESDRFDAGWYLAAYPQVARLRITPAEHYIRYGAFEGKNPSGSFLTLGYLARYPDVIKSGMNPLLHFIRYGRAEGRSDGRF